MSSDYSLSFGPSSFGLRLIGHPLGLLRPLLTSRSSLLCRPFRHKARSPQVRTHSFITQPPGLRHFALITKALRFRARSPCLAAPSIRFLFIGSQFMVHASFPHSVTLMQLRFTSFVVINLRRDLHPQECAHAGRTQKSRLCSRLFTSIASLSIANYLGFRGGLAAPVNRGGSPVCWVNMLPFLGAPPLTGSGVEFLRRALL